MLLGTAILSIGIFNGVMLSLTLWMTGRDRFLAFGILIYTAHLLKYLGYWLGFFPDHVVLAQMLRPMELLLGPILLGCLSRLGNWRIRWEWVHYLPFFLLTAIIGIYCFFQYHYLGEVKPFFPRPTMITKMSHELLYMGLFFRHKLSKSMIIIVIFYVLHWILSLLYMLFKFQGDIEYISIGLFAGMVFAVNYLAFMALRSSKLFPSKPKKAIRLERDTEVLDVYERLKRLIVAEKLFLNHNLKISDVARRLEVNEKVISRAVNEHAGDNFNVFINQFRVAHASDLMLDEKFAHYTIDAIGEESGFANKVSFYKAFKRINGDSPTIWKKSKRRAYNNLVI